MATEDPSLLARLWRWFRRRDAITEHDRHLGVRSVRDNPSPERIDDPKFPSM